MIAYYFQGILSGLLFAFSFGPAFFANINASISRGFFAGVMVAVGVSMTDAAYTFLAVYGLSSLLENPSTQFWITLVGGLVIITFGLISILVPIKGTREEAERPKPFYLYFIQGLVVNGLNPYVAVFWAGIVAATYVELSLNQGQAIFYFAGLLTTTLSLDITKAALASRVYPIIGSDRMSIFGKVIGTIFVLIGLGMLASLVI